MEEASPGLWGLPKRGLAGSFRSHAETTAIETPVRVECRAVATYHNLAHVPGIKIPTLEFEFSMGA